MYENKICFLREKKKKKKRRRRTIFLIDFSSTNQIHSV